MYSAFASRGMNFNEFINGNMLEFAKYYATKKHRKTYTIIFFYKHNVYKHIQAHP